MANSINLLQLTQEIIFAVRSKSSKPSKPKTLVATKIN